MCRVESIELSVYCIDSVSNIITKNWGSLPRCDSVESEFLRPADIPWRGVHMDVQSPYVTDGLGKVNFVITLVESCTGYLLTECTRYSPTAHHLVAIFRRVLNVFNASPETCHTDNGSIFVGAEFLASLKSVHCQSRRPPVGASWCNGKVERVHRTLHEYLLAHAVSSDFASFDSVVRRVT